MTLSHPWIDKLTLRELTGQADPGHKCDCPFHRGSKLLPETSDALRAINGDDVVLYPDSGPPSYYVASDGTPTR